MITGKVWQLKLQNSYQYETTILKIQSKTIILMAIQLQTICSMGLLSAENYNVASWHPIKYF